MTLQETGTENEPRLLALLALVSGVLPIIAINAAYVLAALSETVPRCIPYLDGCTSISSTGRTHPSVWIFKPVMLLTAVFMATFFVKSARFTEPGTGSRRDILALLGLAGAAALILYLVFLGTEGPAYRLLRRYGVTLYFGCTYLAQLLLARRLSDPRFLQSARPARWMLALCALLLVLGIASIPISNFVADKDQIENVIEWIFALLMQLNFLLAWQAFRTWRPESDQCGIVDDER